MFFRFLVFRVERPSQEFRARERLKEQNVSVFFKTRFRCEDLWYLPREHIATSILKFCFLLFDECEHNVSAPSVSKS